ncbi:MAG: hypothetical protein KDE01_10505, partial [Caldilineaceae bacterium]|nr:hypothetical protein [Caldilineaceae bacterium]
ENGELQLTNDIAVSGHFTNSGTLDTNGSGITFDGAKTQNLVLNTFTSFDALTVYTGTTLVEAVTDDNAYIQGTLTNFGTIRKTQPVSGLEFYYFGLAGFYPDSWGVEIEVTDRSGGDPLTA